MTNLFHKKNKQEGAATLIIAIILMLATTLIIIFAADQGRLLQNITTNQNRNAQAFQAAEAGLEYAINYLQQNSSAILANPVNGYIPAFSNSNTTNVSLANGSKYSFVYTNPIANNYNLIKITSTGTSDDGTATRVISQEVQRGSLLSNPGSTALVTKGSVALGGSGLITNTVTNQTIESASTVTLSGNGQTATSSGGSSSGHMGSDIQQNMSSLANMSQNDFFATYFGTTNTSTIQGQAAHYYNNSSNTNYSSTLNGLTGTSIWIDQTNGSSATLNGNTTIGSAANPVLLIVNGSLSITGNVTIYGFVFTIGTSGITTALAGNNSIVGGLVTTDNINMTGNSSLTFNSTILNNLQNQNGMLYYAKVPGTWKDF